MHLDHANIVTADLDRTVGFFTEVLGLSNGPRPDFQVPGYWLYSEGRPLIHLTQATLARPSTISSPRIDHVALRVASLEEWNALLGRLQAQGIDYQLNVGNDIQLWVALAPGVTVEVIVAGSVLQGSE